MEESITPGQNGLPPRKVSYDEDDKALIVTAAAEVGTRVVADAYGMDWHYIASWKRFYGKERNERNESEFNTMSKKKNKTKTAAKNSSTVKVTVSNTPVAPAMSAAPVLIIQSPSGQEITADDIRAKVSTAVGSVDKVYIRADEGKAYWVRGEGEKEEHGAVDLW